MELVFVVNLVSNDTEDDESAEEAPQGLGHENGDGGKEETSETGNQKLNELGTEEGEG